MNRKEWGCREGGGCVPARGWNGEGLSPMLKKGYSEDSGETWEDFKEGGEMTRYSCYS